MQNRHFFPFHSIGFVRCFFYSVVAYSLRLNPELSSIIKIDGKKENIDAWCCLPYTQYHSVDSCSQRATHDTQQPNHNCSSKWNDPCVNKSVANQVCSIYYIKVRLNSFKYPITLTQMGARAPNVNRSRIHLRAFRNRIHRLDVELNPGSDKPNMANRKYRPSEVISISVWWPSINLTNSVMNLKWRPNNAINHLQTLTICFYVPNVFSRPNEIVLDSLNLQTCFPKTKIGKNAYFQPFPKNFSLLFFFLHLSPIPFFRPIG